MFPLHMVLADARLALRLLVRRPAFSAALIAILVLGIGATTAMFSLTMSLFGRPLPFRHPEELSVVETRQPMMESGSTSIPDFVDWRARANTFEGMAAVAFESYGLSSPGETPESVGGAEVSGDFFAVYQTRPQKGRLFGPDDDHIGAPKVAVISAALWQRRFASDPGVVGRTVLLSSEPYTVIGVAEDGFRFASPDTGQSDVWTPIAVARKKYAVESSEEYRGSHFMTVVGRRKAGVTLVQAQAELSTIADAVAHEHPDADTFVKIRVVDMHEAVVGSARDAVWVLFGAVGLVFLVMCANVANLLLARAASRRGEMATRAALGASRRRLAAQLVTETVVLFLVAAVLGSALAKVLVGVFAAGLVGNYQSMPIDIGVDGAALAFAIGSATLCGIVFGLVPAAEAARSDPQSVLKETGSRASMGQAQRAVRGGLVVVQVALALALLAGSGLALRAFSALASTPLGFDPDGVVCALIALPEAKYGGEESGEKMVAFQREVIARLAARPGVESASGNSQLPLGGSNSNADFVLEGKPPWEPGAAPMIEQNLITPGYFHTMGIPILRGRDFTDADVKSSRMVTIISKRVADTFFRDADPIGHRLAFGSDTATDKTTWLEIVGVVGDVRRRGLAKPIEYESYMPAAQIPVRWLSVVARSQRPDQLLQELPELVASIDADQAITTRRRMSDRVAQTIGPQRFATRLLGAFAVLALVLATLGLFGLVSYTTNQRTRELGIRLALGSSPEGVVAVVAREGMLLLGAGLATGLVGAVFVGRLIAGRVAGAAAFDPVVFGTILGVLGVAGTLASLVPALRAIRIPPAASLRYE